ncbi:MAG: DUF5017 domain-containing protein [Bacteroidia bacterium]|nr:DUF5017 domain-containing protein [Bacteroidia bacterium]
MKYTSKLYILVLSMVVIFFNGCIKEKYSTPEQKTPKVDFTSNLTIAKLKTASTGFVSIGDTMIIGTDTIVNPIIQGIISADDESGNIYKTIYLQDNTAGIQIAVDKTSLYTTFKKGQRIFVKLTGLYLGVYGGVPQIGYTYGGTIGRIPEVLINTHIFNDSLPGNPPTPIIRTIPSIVGGDPNLNMLVKLTKVHFAEVGSVYADVNVTTNRTILDSAGNSIILRNSGYANFRAELMPKGQGDIVGILSEYSGAKQFYIRDLNDLQNWDSTIIYPVNIINETFTTSLGTFTQYNVLGDQIWAASSYGAKMSGYSGSYYANEDWLISPSINFNNYNSETLSFISTMNYGTAGDGSLKLYTSLDYSGTGNPNLATWTEVTPLTLSPGSWTDTPSGNIDLSALNGTNVHFAFKYTCSTSNVATWELTTLMLSAKPN